MEKNLLQGEIKENMSKQIRPICSVFTKPRGDQNDILGTKLLGLRGTRFVRYLLGRAVPYHIQVNLRKEKVGGKNASWVIFPEICRRIRWFIRLEWAMKFI